MKVITLDELSVVGIKVTANWKELHTKMPEAWKVFIGRIEEIENRKSDVMMDVSLEVNDGVYTQLIGVETEGPGGIPEGMESVNIPRQKYLAYRHEGPLQEVATFFRKMYDWAKSQNLTLDEFKVDRGYTAGGKEEHDLYIRYLSIFGILS